MAVNLSVKNVPASVAERLRARAQRHRRSLQRELLSILEAAAGGPDVGPAAVAPGVPTAGDRISIEELAARARARFPRGTTSSVSCIREMRDTR